MALAKNKLAVLVIAKSLLGENPDETIYRMAADGVLYIDDEEDTNMLKSQQIRMVTADISAYINQLTQLMIEIDNAAKDQVDMTPQRYGQIANSAGKGVTDEAIMRGSMGSVIIEFIFDCLRERDYARDLDLDMAIAAIAGDNVASIKKLIMKFQELQQQHEQSMQQLEQQTKQMEAEFEIQKIAAKGEEDRKTVELEKYLDQQIELIKADANMISFNNGVSNQDKQAGMERLEQARANVERDKNQIAREKNILDFQSKAADRAVKLKDIETKLAIAKENKNKYDNHKTKK